MTQSQKQEIINYTRWKNVPEGLLGIYDSFPKNRKARDRNGKLNVTVKKEASPKALINNKPLYSSEDFIEIYNELDWNRQGYLLKDNEEPIKRDLFAKWQVIKNTNMRQKPLPLKKDEKWHTSKWYKENFGVDPVKLNLPYAEVKNPHYSQGATMPLWEEQTVIDYKNETGVYKFKKRQEAGNKAYKTRMEKAKKYLEWFKQKKQVNRYDLCDEDKYKLNYLFKSYPFSFSLTKFGDVYYNS